MAELSSPAASAASRPSAAPHSALSETSTAAQPLATSGAPAAQSASGRPATAAQSASCAAPTAVESPPGRSATAAQSPASHGLHGRALALVFFGLLLAMFISSLSETIASTALPTIVGDLNGVEIMQWVSTAYILTSTLTMPVYGKLGDLIGRKRLLMTALGLYAAGKVLCGLAVNMEMLIGAASFRVWAEAVSSSCPRRRFPMWYPRASWAHTWVSSARCSPCRMCWGR